MTVAPKIAALTLTHLGRIDAAGDMVTSYTVKRLHAIS